MKKALLFPILALSISAFSQNIIPTYDLHNTTSNPKEKVLRRISDGTGKTSEIYTGNNFKKTIIHQTPEQLLLIPLMDSIYNWGWLLNLSWKIDFKIIDIIYGANNNLSSYVQQHLILGGWYNDIKYTLTFDANGNQTSELEQDWIGAWVNKNQTIFTYDANNNQISELAQSWNGSGWETLRQIIYSYDTNNNKISSLYQNWSGSEWENTTLYTYTYDTNNNQIGEVRQSWDGAVWLAYTQITYYYDSYNYRTGGLALYLVEGIWKNHAQYTYAYDVNHNWISELIQNWIGNEWVNRSQINYTYDSDNFLTSEVEKFFDDGVSVITGDSIHYYFHSVTGINNLKSEAGTFVVYPNPSGGKFSISSESPLEAIDIFNILGERIYSDHKFSQQNSTQIDLSSYGYGIYFINVYDGVKMYTRKIVVQ